MKVRFIGTTILSFAAALVLQGAVITGVQAQEKQEAKPWFKDGEAQIVKAFEDPDRWIREDLWVETEFDSDGDGRSDRMHVDVTRPAETETEGLKLPVVYNTSPYFAGTAGNNPSYFWDVRHELGEEPKPHAHPTEIKRRGVRPIISKGHVSTWLPRGYIVVHSSSPGTGLSDGVPTIGGDNESLAPKAVIDWLCGRAKGYTTRTGNKEVKAYWSTGKVGMTGTSYNGTLPLAAATTGVEGLEAIIPVAPNTSYYHYYRSNGLVRSPGGYLGEDVDVLFDFIHSGDESKREYARKTVRDTEMKNGQDRVTGDYNDFWAGRDYLNKMDKMKAALLMSHGFNDWNVVPEHSLRIYEAARTKGLPAQIYYHQNGHGGPPPVSMMNRWFTRYLFGVENGVENDPKAWIVRENDEQGNPTSYADYPNPDASPVTLHLTKGAPEKGSLTVAKPTSQGKEALVDNYSFSAEALAKAENTDHRLIYVTPVLKEEVHLSGKTVFTIRAASSKPAVNLSVYLVSLPWNDHRGAKITDNLITRGWADLQNYKSLWDSEPLKPGRFYEMTFELQPDDQVIPAGQQIGLMIFSSDRDFTLQPEPGTELRVDLDGTSVSLPVVGGAQAWMKATGEF
ncbi:Xaa-Pro dipeptidyl-peptidase [Maribellus luteus]|uniref:Xaa-Pro dipeptidyl-peptidase n=1 Tax=Maribellus luteus TaxID=2305463 RepID=A0A399T4S0_9BACT|nr:Xaa-Pro dipeptidyl-peptidase [Maribellus luteus]RIJ48873.1 Xaa-Pro dipeptidyl-peptidase [Maribellus luteus]